MYWLKLIHPWRVVTAFLLVYLGFIWLTNERDSQVFVTLGSCFSQCLGNDGESCPIPPKATPKEELAIVGYDGQFNYYIARDPAQAAPCIDVPAYRYQRIGLPMLGWLFSLGQESWLPWIFVLINSLALILSTALLEKLLQAEKRSPWFALSYGLFVGVVLGVRLSTTEPLAYALVIGAIWFYQTGRTWVYPLCLAGALLTKETTLLAVAGFCLWLLWSQEWRTLARVLVISLTPFVAWQVYLATWLGQMGVGSGGANATPFEIIPLAGFFKIWTEGSFLLFIIYGVIFVGLFVLLPTFWGLYTTLTDGWRKHKVTLYGCLLFTSAAIMLFIPFSTYREFLGMLRFIPMLVIGVVLYSAEQNYRRPLLYSTLWIILLLFLRIG